MWRYTIDLKTLVERNGSMSNISPRESPCYCIKLRQAANILTKFYDKAFAPINLTTNQFSLISAIHLLQPCNKSDLAQYIRLDRTTVIRSLDILRQKKLIEEVKGPSNRNKVIQLSVAGEAAIIEGFAIWKSVQNEVKLIIGEENESALGRIFANIQSLEP